MKRFATSALAVVGVAAFVFCLSGCGGNGLPETVTIELPDGTTQEVVLGAGVPSLANSTWDFYQASGAAQTTVFLTISFGPEGNLDRFDGNSIAPQIFGDTILFDGERHSTNQPGISYAAATYGAETNDATGFAFEGILTAFAGGIQAATASASASGTFDPADPDTMRGSFSITSEVTLAQIPGADVNETFNFEAHRVE